MKDAPLTNVARLRRLLFAAPFDAVIASSPENLSYCSGYYGGDLHVLKERQHFAVWTTEGEPAFIAPGRISPVEQSADRTFIEDVRGYDFYAREAPADRDEAGYARMDRSPVPLLADALRDRGLTTGRIGVEYRHLWPQHLQELQRLLPRATFADCTLFFETVRMVKTPAEMDLLSHAARAAAQAALAAFGGARVGDPAKDIADRLSYLVAHLGARQLRHAEMEVCREGRRLSVFGREGVGLRLQPGDVLRVDFFGWFNYYHSDIARMAVVGDPALVVTETYRRLYEGIHVPMLQAPRAGMMGAQLYAVAKPLFEAAVGKVPGGMIVHGLGLDTHERPWCHPLEEFALEAGMVLSVESIFHAPVPMYHVEDLVVIGEDGRPTVVTVGLGSEAPVRIE